MSYNELVLFFNVYALTISYNMVFDRKLLKQ